MGSNLEDVKKQIKEIQFMDFGGEMYMAFKSGYILNDGSNYFADNQGTGTMSVSYLGDLSVAGYKVEMTMLYFVDKYNNGVLDYDNYETVFNGAQYEIKPADIKAAKK